jgi:peptidoglycan-associated lipoprotein
MVLHGRRWMPSIVLASGLALTLACGAKRPVSPPAPPPAPPPVQVASRPVPPPPPPPPPAPRPPDAPAVPTEAEIFSRLSLRELNAKEPLDDAFFAYDMAELSETDRTALQRDADWLKKWSSVRVVIEGHADERGTNEYNLALGEARATMARTYLASLGIDPNRIATVSKGEEQPFCALHDEGCWVQNRRAHFIITAK